MTPASHSSSPPMPPAPVERLDGGSRTLRTRGLVGPAIEAGPRAEGPGQSAHTHPPGVRTPADRERAPVREPRRRPAANAGPIFVVLNGASGRASQQQKIDAIRAALDGSDRSAELLIAHRPGELPALANRAADLAIRRRGVIAAAGGDGTVSLVARVAVARGITMGVVPEGTFNMLARCHGIPEDPVEAVGVLLNGRVRPIQVGRLNDLTFLVNASIGLYPRLLSERETYKRRFGRSRVVAVWAALATLIGKHRPLDVALVVDGQEQRLRTPTLFVGNNRMQLERIGIEEAAALDRHRLVALASEPVGTLGALKLLLQGAIGRLDQADELITFVFESLTVHKPVPRRPGGARGRVQRIRIAIDGESQTVLSPLTFGICENPLNLIVPPAPEDDHQETVAAPDR